MRAAWLVLALAGCDPIWSANVGVRDPANAPIEDATVAVACPDDGDKYHSMNMSVRTKADGSGRVGGLGPQFPAPCDVYVAKPGFKTHRIRYREICPNGPDGCRRVFELQLVLERE